MLARVPQVMQHPNSCILTTSSSCVQFLRCRNLITFRPIKFSLPCVSITLFPNKLMSPFCPSAPSQQQRPGLVQVRTSSEVPLAVPKRWVCSPRSFWVYVFTISVRYFGRSAMAFAIIAAAAALSSLGGGIVRVATGTPTARNNSSCPAGEQMQSNRAGSLEAFVKE